MEDDFTNPTPDLKKPRRKSQATAAAQNLDRLPPSAPESERACLGCILSAEDCMAEAIIALKGGVESFYELQNQAVYDTMLALHAASKPINLITVMQHLKDTNKLDQVGGLAYLSTLQDGIPSAAMLGTFLEIVSDKWKLRKTIKGCTEIVAKCYNESDDVPAIMDTVEGQLVEMAKQRDTSNQKNIRSLIHGAISKIESIHASSGALTGLSTGYVDFDRLTMGLQPGEMTIIAGRPSSGKTSWAMNVAEYVAVELGQPVGVFSLEMSAEALAMRMLCSRARFNLRNVNQGFLAEKDFPNLTNASSKLAKSGIHIDDQRGGTILQLRSKARLMWQQYGIKLFVLDYLQLLRSDSKKARNREQEIADISSGTKTLAGELGVPVIALSQLTRDSKASPWSRPSVQQLRESGCLSVKTTRLLTSEGVQYTMPSLMNTYSLNKAGINVVKSSKYIDSGTKKIVRLVLRSGRYLDCTPNHKILTDRGFVEASKITKEHSVASVRKIEEPKGVMPVPEARWMGWMLGNGSMMGYSSPSFICSCQTIAEKFCAETKTLFGLTPHPHKHWSKKVFQFDITKGKKGPTTNSCKAWLLAHDMWGRRSPEKIIPEWFMAQADNESIAQLVAGMWETDGCITKTTLKYSTTSNEMAWQLVWCLSRLGIFAYIDNGYMSDKANFSCFSVSISDGRDVEKFRQIVPMAGRKGDKLKGLVLSKEGSNHGDRLGVWVGDAINTQRKKHGKSYSQIGYRPQGKRISQDDLGKLIVRANEFKNFSHLVCPAIYWDTLEEIKAMGSEPVFDREVINGPHNFVANGIIVHNSLEQDADLVGLLFRSQAPEEDAPPSMIVPMTMEIAKQRNGATGDLYFTFYKEFTKFETASKVSQDDVPPCPVAVEDEAP